MVEVDAMELHSDPLHAQLRLLNTEKGLGLDVKPHYPIETATLDCSFSPAKDAEHSNWLSC